LIIVSKFFEPDQQLVRNYKFPEDPEMVPGHLVCRKNTIERQLNRAEKDIVEREGYHLCILIDTGFFFKVSEYYLG